jgi:hypothetical protein
MVTPMPFGNASTNTHIYRSHYTPSSTHPVGDDSHTSTPLPVKLKLVSGPQRPVVEIAPRLCFLQETASIENSIVSLKPKMPVGLPSQLHAGPVSDKSRLTTIGSSDQKAGYSVDAILKTLSPLKNPIGRHRHVMRKRRLDVRMNIDEVNRTGTRRSQNSKVVSLWKKGIEGSQVL